jgi:DNA-binding helix-hairpin-helix protein with protein kinase domain/Tfp pilus assembly protein PilF
MPPVYYTSRGEPIRLGPKLGGGGEGAVYELEGALALAAKIYHEPPSAERAAKLLALSRLGTERLLKLTAWPVDVLSPEAGGPVVGFLMPRIGQAEEVHALHSPKSRLQKFPDASWAFLIYVAANIARAVAAVHEHGYVVGDLNPKNILVTPRATVTLLDCDSFQVEADGRIYRCEGGFPEYTPPELQGLPFREVDRTQAHDCFGLAVVVFQLLFLGRHPFSGRFLGAGEMPLERAIKEARFAYGDGAESRQMQPPPGTLPFAALPATIAELFSRAFLSTNRPEPREWVEPLESLAKSLRRCELHNGHHFSALLAACPWCEIELRAGVRLFNFALPGGQSRASFRLNDIWKEIEAVPPPEAVALATRSEMLAAVTPSEEAAARALQRRERFILSLVFAVLAGFAVAYKTDAPLSLLLVIAASFAAARIARRPVSSGDDLLKRLQQTTQDAKTTVRSLEQKWEKEAGQERFTSRREALQAQKETYEELAALRERKLKQLESAAREKQLREHLGAFRLADAEVRGVGKSTKKTLRTHGITTADELMGPRLLSIPGVGESRTAALLEWRRELEGRFVYDASRGVTPRARLAVEKEMDELRAKLEHELRSGAFYLRRIRQEIETSRPKLAPALTDARRALAQAEKDWDVAGKRNSWSPAFLLLVATFCIASVGEWVNESKISSKLREADRPIEAGTSNDQNQTSYALYQWGSTLMRQGNFTLAAEELKRAIALDPQQVGAYYELGYALFRLGKYEESIAVSQKALTFYPAFQPSYNLGLAHSAKEEWAQAAEAFEKAIASRDSANVWIPQYTEVCYRLGIARVKRGMADGVKRSLEQQIKTQKGAATVWQRVELGTLYLLTGETAMARKQARLLARENKTASDELLGLIDRRTSNPPSR